MSGWLIAGLFCILIGKLEFEDWQTGLWYIAGTGLGGYALFGG